MTAVTVWKSLHLLQYLVLMDFSPLDFRLQEGSAVSLRFMVLLQVYLGSGSEWVIKTDAKFLHECVLRGVALPVVPWVGMTVTGWYVMDSWILLVSAIFEELLTDDD